jgi:chromosomal replication initiation ATPase DnaA
VFHRRSLRASTVDLDDILALLSARFNVSQETVFTTSPYRGYAVYFAKKLTPLFNPEIGGPFGNITFSAVSKIVSRLSARVQEDEEMQKDLEGIERQLSSVKGLP